ncbi:MAG: type II toxin-antitoxin system ParD family antitoxin [Verrucomicrobiota bacterium]
MSDNRLDLPPELESFVEAQIASGRFSNANEVHCAALEAMARRKQERDISIGRLNADIEVGLRDLEAGRTTHYNSLDELESRLDGILDQMAEETA